MVYKTHSYNKTAIMKNPIEIIKRDHRKVETLFKEYEELGDTAFATKEKKVREITQLLKVHTDMEERLFYPKAREVFGKEDDKMVEEAFAEHDVAKRLLEELSVTHPEDPQFDAKVKVLNENVTHHVMEEEQELLPCAEKEMKDELLNQIGEDMESFRVENGLEEQGS